MASEKAVPLTDADFDDGVGKGVVLLDMRAPWCGPCMMEGQIVEQVAETVGEKAEVAKLNVDEGRAVAARLGIHSIPTLILFKDGDEVRRFVGLQSETALVSAIKDVLKA